MSAGATDASLIARTRSGDMAAYDELYRRHVDDTAKVARIVTDNSDDAPDIVNEAFTRVLTRLTEGGGPDDNLRPYLRTIVRRLAVDRFRGQKRHTSADPEILDVLPTADDPIGRADDKYLVRNAFETLPERWQRVLWHTEIEGRSPSSLATALDMAPNSVAALAYRAREGLRQAYLSVNLPRQARPECRAFAHKLPAFTRGTLSPAASTELTDHLGTCGDCRERRDELLLLASDLRGVLAPALLLPAAGGTAAAAAGAGVAGGGLLAWLSPTTWAKNPGAMAGAAAGVVAVGIAVALAVTGGDAESPEQSAAPPPATAAPAPPADPPEEPTEAEDPPDAEDPDTEPVSTDVPTDEVPSPPDEPEPDAPAPPEEQPDEPEVTDPEVPDPEPGPPDPPSPDEPDPAPPSFEVDLDTSVQVGDGGAVRFSVQVSGQPTPQLQWQRRAPSDEVEDTVPTAATHPLVTSADAPSGWTDIGGATGTEFVVPSTTWENDGEQYRVVATNPNGTIASAAATLDVRYEPQILADPQWGDPREVGTSIELSATVRSNPAIAAADVTWERQAGSGSWAPVDVPTSVRETGRRTVVATTRFTTSIPDHDARFRAVVTNEQGDPVATAPALADVRWSPLVAAPPADTSAPAGGTVRVQARVSGNPLDTDDLSWEQLSPDGGTWRPAVGDVEIGPGRPDSEAGVRTTLVVGDAGKELNGIRYRVVVADDEPVVSDDATVTVTWGPEILDGPAPTTVDEGEAARFTAAFTASPFEPAETRWEYRASPDEPWEPVADEPVLEGDPATVDGAVSTLEVEAGRDLDAGEYRFVAASGTASEPAELTVAWTPGIVKHPASREQVEHGASVAPLTVSVDADRSATLEWQRRHRDGTGWEPVPDQPDPTREGTVWSSELALDTTEFVDRQYRVVVRSGTADVVRSRVADVTIVATGSLVVTDGTGSPWCVGIGPAEGHEDLGRHYGAAVLVECTDASAGLTLRAADHRLVFAAQQPGRRARCLTGRTLDFVAFGRVVAAPCGSVAGVPRWGQRWTSPAFPPAHDDATGTVRLAGLTNVCLDVDGGVIEPGRPLITFGCHEGPNQQFRFERTGS